MIMPPNPATGPAPRSGSSRPVARRIKPQRLRRIFAIPVLLAIASLAGLVLGLTGDGWRDWAASMLLMLPVAAFLLHWHQRD